MTQWIVKWIVNKIRTVKWTVNKILVVLILLYPLTYQLAVLGIIPSRIVFNWSAACLFSERFGSVSALILPECIFPASTFVISTWALVVFLVINISKFLTKNIGLKRRTDDAIRKIMEDENFGKS